MVKNNKKCQFCKFTAQVWLDLKTHVLEVHPDEFFAIEQWINDTTDERLIEAKRLAAEGLKG